MAYRPTTFRTMIVLPAALLSACAAIALLHAHGSSGAAEKTPAGSLILAQTKAEKAAPTATKAKSKGANEPAAMGKGVTCPAGQTFVPSRGRGAGGGSCM